MPDETLPLTPRASGLDEVLAEFVAAEEQGQSPDRQGLLSRYPQFAADLREFFVNRDEMQRLAAPLRDAPEQGAAEGQRSGHPLLKIRYFGDYELLEEIAVGGMGVVYKARQVSLNRVVAVKMILKGTLAAEEDVKRFRAEAEAAANLQHPAIVAIHEVGLHEGQHYFSMDFVEGHSLAQLPREQPLTARQAAEYVRDAAEAVHYAHQQGTLHRDLKPSNILIDRQGRVRITDFGLAKKITGDSDLTLTGQILGTPSYMPPEQALGKRSLIGAASDIYSLGAVLYELLTGRPPFRGESPAETLRQVESLDPISPRLLSPAVPRDLETICLKCLEKEPHKRYGTAQLLADDLGRYLRGEAVLARPPSPIYRFTKFARRHMTGLAITALIVLFIVLLGGVVGWMVRDREAQRAEYEKRITNYRATRLAKTVEDIQLALQEAQTLGDRALTLVNDNPYQWEATLAAALTACKRADSLAEENKGTLDPVLLERLTTLRQRLETDEQDRQFVARIDAIRMEATQVDIEKNRFGTTWQSSDIEDLFKSRGIEFRATSSEEVVASIQTHSEPIQPHMLAGLEIWLTRLPNKAAEKRQWLTTTLQSADSDPWRTQARKALLLGDVIALEKLVRDVEPAQQPAAVLLLLAKRLPPQMGPTRLEFFRRIQNAHPGDFWVNQGYAEALSRSDPPQWIEAVRFYTAMVALRPQNPGCRFNLGRALSGAGHHEGAIACYLDAVAIAPHYAAAWTNLGSAYYEKGEFGDAMAAFRRAIRLNPDYASPHIGLGTVLRAKGDADGAIVEYRVAVRLDPKDALSHNNLGVALTAKGDLNGAIAEYRESIRLDAPYARPHYNLGNLLKSKGDLEGAIAEYREAIRVNPSYATAHNSLGVALKTKGDLDGAIAEYREAIRLDPRNSKTHYNLGKALRMKGDRDGAIAAYRKALEVAPGFAEAEANLKSILEERSDGKSPQNEPRQDK
jgi:eukaryotic-like serine/threonine-protein kinase